MTEPMIWPAGGAFTISTTWTSTGPFKTQTAAFLNAATIQQMGGVTRAIYSGGGGNLQVIMFDGSTGYFPSLPAGGKIEVRAIALSSLNAATGLTGMY